MSSLILAQLGILLLLISVVGYMWNRSRERKALKVAALSAKVLPPKREFTIGVRQTGTGYSVDLVQGDGNRRTILEAKDTASLLSDLTEVLQKALLALTNPAGEGVEAK